MATCASLPKGLAKGFWQCPSYGLRGLCVSLRWIVSEGNDFEIAGFFVI